MAVAKVILNGNTLIDTTQKTVQADKMVASYTALDKAGESITGSIATKTSVDLTASGATVTAPAGYYASSASKAVSSGSATTPATTITANPTISVNSSTGVISASVSNTQSVTPTVSAGYVSSGTAGTITVSGSNTSALSTQEPKVITPSTSAQTAVAAGKYTLGAVTVYGDANLVAGNIKDGTTIFGVTGTYSGGGSSTPTFTLIWENDYPWDGDTSYIHSLTCDKTYAECLALANQNIGYVGFIEDTLDGENYSTYAGILNSVGSNKIEYTIVGGGSYPFYDVTYNNSSVITLTAPSASAETLNATANGTYYPSGGVFTQATVNVSGSGGEPATQKQINFIDYDGTILYSYTSAEWANVTALPSNPSHTGLTAQGWNWSKAQIDAQLTAMPNGDIWVGQMYITSSGDTEIDVYFPDSARLSPILAIAVNGSITVDWGDNTTPDTVTGTSLTSRKAVSHTYASVGDYVIKIHVVSGAFAFYSSSSYTLLRKNTSQYENRVYANCIQAVRLGSGITSIGNNAFINCNSLASVTIPNSITSIGEYAFNNCYSLAFVTIPNNITSIGTYAFFNCYSLASVTMPNSITSIGGNIFYNCYSLVSTTIPSGVASTGNNLFYGCYSLPSISIPSGVTSIGTYVFYNCYSLASVTISNSITSIGNDAFNSCYSLASVTIPNSVTSIGNNAFASCYGVAEYHVKPTSPPTLGTNVFSNIVSDCKIYVPSASLSTYQTASNWSTYASYMVGE